MKKNLLLTLGTLVSIAISMPVFSKTNIKVGHGAADTYHMHKAWVKFKEIVEKESNQEITVDIFPNGQVGGDRELTEAVQSGIVDMTSPVVEVMSGWDNAFTVPGLPYIFPNREGALKALYGEFGNKLLEKAQNFGLEGLGWMENGIRNITSNVNCPITKPGDLKGVKIRTMQVDAHMDAFKAMGAKPTPMSFNEVYSALQQGVIDAEENPLGHIYSSHFYEVQKCVTLSGHVYSTHMVLANPDFYNGLSETNRALVNSALKRAIDYQQEVIAKEEQEQINAIRAAGVTVTELTPEQSAVFEKVVAPVREKYTEAVDPELIKALESVKN
ncbi:TRAP transporter substrate-binding protein [Basfia succiniciproducens]|uniref:TRAP transporter substrate-binding protein n=1 Tax=Basfia succiniciproducens TaxID=653940 RepID=UPI0008BAF2D1|nr:TRAP transporter substrate-binding protein [Basfia succiniciproducens]SEQ09271.1 tripartite ATP-independent transporter solute receptor, DctP family [Basfia succiniciproducens]